MLLFSDRYELDRDSFVTESAPWIRRQAVIRAKRNRLLDMVDKAVVFKDERQGATLWSRKSWQERNEFIGTLDGGIMPEYGIDFGAPIETDD